MFVKYGHEYAELCDHLGLDTEASAARQSIDAVEQAVLTAGWDGAWFRRAYDAFGNPIGSKECAEGRSLSSHRACASWRASAGDRTGRAGACQRGGAAGHQIRCGAAAARSHRLSAEFREISSHPPGYKENAGSSATTTRGSAAPRQRWVTATAPLRSTARPAPPTSRTSLRSTAPNPTFTARWWQARTPPPSAKPKTAG